MDVATTARGMFDRSINRTEILNRVATHVRTLHSRETLVYKTCIGKIKQNVYKYQVLVVYKYQVTYVLNSTKL